ncbi:YhgE/Pip domain-containing protein [Furfurilactobacillus siliginis]|uniref:ABC-2 type transporter transmembrane domain-containing protein n=1 Tax=Furfurilactobacillus siliginis TaxID=348151 RepID=A0A0R2LFF3_9LACO|nr:ABC transporter permease [Furfurilactobacillus siliginis]KRN97325.1 hypothetical protein IV55_GL000253 [Furfurilactobacillus siliginis]GEK29178.1 hypothetical protein LSI01_14890 [Furfurilactobacillus siliginis]
MTKLALLKRPLVWLFSALAIVIAIFFSTFLLPAFHDLPTSTNKIPVAVINQDTSTTGKTVTKQLTDNLPFKHIHQNVSLKTAQQQLNNRQLGLVIRIPSNFTTQVMAGKETHVHYYVSDANGMVQNNMNKALISNATNSIANHVTTNKAAGMFAKVLGPQIAQQAQAKFASSPQAAQLQGNPAAQAAAKQQLTAQVQQTTETAAKQMSAALAKGVTPITHVSNKLPARLSHQMAPMTLGLGTYLGTMIMSVMLVAYFMGQRFESGKWAALLATQVVGFVTAVILPCFSVTTLRLIIHLSGAAFWGTLTYNMLFTLAIFEFVTAIAFLLGGLPSMLIQLPLFIMQVVTGGIIVPHDSLNGFYHFIANCTPMYAGMTGSQNYLFGGGQTGMLSGQLWLITLVGLTVTVCCVAIGYRSAEPKGLAKMFS